MRLFSLFMTMALRNVIRNRRRSSFTVLAMSFGLCCLIIFQGLKSGLHLEMINSTISVDTGSIQIHGADQQGNTENFNPVDDPEQVGRILQRIGINQFSYRIKGPALLLTGHRSSSVLLSGIVPSTEPSITFIRDKLVAGTYLGQNNHLLISERLATDLHLQLGDRLTIMLQRLDGTPVNKTLVVGGLFHTALASFDRRQVFLSLETFQHIIGAHNDFVTEIVCRTDLNQLQNQISLLQNTLPAETYTVKPWQEIAPDVVQLIELNDATMTILILIVFLIVAMGIANTITVILYERFHELGIMSAIGTRPGEMMLILLSESFFLGLVGALLGTLLGTGASLYLARYGVDLTSMTSTNQYFANSHILKSNLQFNDVALANLLVLLTTMMASIYPAWKAAYSKPLQAITTL